MMARMSYPRYKEIVTTSRTQVKKLKKTTFRCVRADCSTILQIFLHCFSFFFFFLLGAIDDLLDLQPAGNGMKRLCMSVSCAFQLQAPSIIFIIDVNCFQNLKV